MADWEKYFAPDAPPASPAPDGPEHWAGFFTPHNVSVNPEISGNIDPALDNPDNKPPASQTSAPPPLLNSKTGETDYSTPDLLNPNTAIAGSVKHYPDIFKPKTSEVDTTTTTTTTKPTGRAKFQDTGNLNMNTGEEVLGAAGNFDAALGLFMHYIDNVQTTIDRSIVQLVFGSEARKSLDTIRDKYNIDPLNPGAPRPFKMLADACNYCANSAPENSETVPGQIMGGVGSIGPTILASWVAPEIKLGQGFAKLGMPILSKFGIVMGAEGYAAGMEKSDKGTFTQKLTTPVLDGVTQFFTGTMYDMMGGMSEKLGSKLAQRFFPEVRTAFAAGKINPLTELPNASAVNPNALNKYMAISNLNSTAFNSIMFGGYGGLSDFLQNGKTTWKSIAVNTGTGLALGLNHVDKMMWAKGMSIFGAVEDDAIQRVASSPIDAETLVQHAQNKAEGNPSEADASNALLTAHTAVLKSVIDEIKTNPDQVIQSIDEMNVDQKVKDNLTDKVNKVQALTDPAVQEAKPLNDELASIDKQIEIINNNPHLGTEDQKIKTAALSARRNAIATQIAGIHDKYAKQQLSPDEQAQADAQKQEDIKQGTLLESKASTLLPTFNQEGNDIAANYGGTFESRIKTPESMVDKANRENKSVIGGSENPQIEDIMGGAVIVPDMKDFKGVSKDLKNQGYDISNKRSPDKETGRRGVTATRTIDTDSGPVTQEVQIHTPETWDAQQKAEALYKPYKNGVSKPEPTPLTPEDDVIHGAVTIPTNTEKPDTDLPYDNVKVNEREIQVGGKTAGKVMTINEAGIAQVRWINLDKDFVGQGHGKDAYRVLRDQARARGEEFVSDKEENQSDESVHVWQSLVKSGEAVKMGDYYIFADAPNKAEVVQRAAMLDFIHTTNNLKDINLPPDKLVSVYKDVVDNEMSVSDFTKKYKDDPDIPKPAILHTELVEVGYAMDSIRKLGKSEKDILDFLEKTRIFAKENKLYTKYGNLKDVIKTLGNSIAEGEGNAFGKDQETAQETSSGENKREDRRIGTENFPDYPASAQAAATEKNQGSTFMLDGTKLGPTKGKSSVALFPDRTEHIDGKVTPDQLDTFVEKNKDVLKGNEEHVGIGTWYDKDTGKTDLDIVAVTGHDRAVDLGKKYNQKAVFNLEKMEETPTGGTGEDFNSATGHKFSEDYSIGDRINDVKSSNYEADMAESKKLYDEAYKGLEDTDLAGSKALTPAQRKAKELGLSQEDQKELSKAWTATKNKIVGELKGKNEDQKQAFKDFLKDLPNLRNLDIRLQTRMLAKVNSIDFTKPKSLDKAMLYFDKIVNNATLNYNIRRAEKALNVLDGKSTEESLTTKTGGVKKNSKGPGGLPLWDEIKSIRGDMENEDYAEGQQKIQEIIDKAAQEGRNSLTADEMNQITRYNFWGALNLTNRGGVNYLTGAARDLMDIRKNGTTKAAADAMVRQEQRAVNSQNYMNVLTGNGKKPVVLDPDVASLMKDSFWKRLRGAILDWPMSSTPKSHLDVLSMHDKTSKPFDSFISRVIGGSQVEANRQNFIDNSEVKTKLQKDMGDIFGSSGRVLKKDAIDRTKTIHTIKYTELGVEKELPMTMNQAITRYMQLQDPTLEKSMESMGYMRDGEPTDKAQKTVGLLTPEAKAWGDYLLHDFYPSMYEKLNPTYRKFYGRDMPFEKMYSPIFVERTDSKVTDDELLGRQSFVNSVKNGSLISRVNHDKPLRAMDCDQVVTSYVHGMLYWKNYTEAVNLLGDFVHDSNVRMAIKQNFTNGDQHVAALQMDLDRMSRKPYDSWALTKGLTAAKNKFVLGALAVNLPVGFKDLTALPAFANYMPVEQIPRYALQSAFQWAGDMSTSNIVKKIWNDAYMQQRVKKGWDVNLNEIMNSDYRDIMDKNNWKGNLMFSTKYGHIASIMIGGVPLYRYTYDQVMKEMGPGSEPFAEARALDAVNNASDETQLSGLDYNISNIQQNPFIKALTMFKSAKMQYQRLASSGARNLIHGRGTPMQNIKTIALFHCVLPMAFQYICNGFKWNTGDEEQAAVLGNLNELFIAGDMIEAVANTLRGKDPWKKYKTSPLGDLPEDVIGTVQHLKKAVPASKGAADFVPELIKAVQDHNMNYLELAKAGSEIGKLIGSVSGLPINATTRMYEGISDVAKGKETGNDFQKILRIIGYSRYTFGQAATDSGLTPEDIKKMYDDMPPDLKGPINFNDEKPPKIETSSSSENNEKPPKL
jgi:Region found in RelA / SpoT proteins